jgi:hypothetical protein
MRNHRADGTTAEEETTCCISREFIKNIFEKLSSGCVRSGQNGQILGKKTDSVTVKVTNSVSNKKLRVLLSWRREGPDANKTEAPSTTKTLRQKVV